MTETPDLAIVTAIYDNYDVLQPIRQQAGLNVEWVCVTDNDDLVAVGRELGWRVIVEKQPDLHPNRAAKRPKMFPWLYTDAVQTIWLDASFRVISETFAAEAIGYADPIAQFKHPWRDCIYTEASESSAISKYRAEPVMGQVSYYQALGHPPHWGLWATGVIARHITPDVIRLSLRWADEIAKWSFQDQISQPFVLREVELRPDEFPDTHFSNDWLVYEGSGRH